MNEIKSMLDDVIKTEIENLKTLETGNDEKSKAVSVLSMLHKLRIEEIKAEADEEDRRKRQEIEELERDRDDAFRKRQLMDGVVDRSVKFGVALAELVLPLIFYGTWMRMGFEFEKEGTFTSSTFKNLFNRFKPTRKG